MTALFFGSFNPIHNGHIAIVRHVLEEGLADEVWLMVSPQNPLKDGATLAPERARVDMARLAVDESGLGNRVEVSELEMGMPRPSYTIDTLDRLRQMYPGRHFVILAGSDIVPELPRWKEWTRLLGENSFLIYPRRGFTGALPAGKMKLLENAPLWDYSSTGVREAVNDAAAEDMLPRGVREYILKNKLWT